MLSLLDVESVMITLKKLQHPHNPPFWSTCQTEACHRSRRPLADLWPGWPVPASWRDPPHPDLGPWWSPHTAPPAEGPAGGQTSSHTAPCPLDAGQISLGTDRGNMKYPCIWRFEASVSSTLVRSGDDRGNILHIPSQWTIKLNLKLLFEGKKSCTTLLWIVWGEYQRMKSVKLLIFVWV